MKKMLSTTGRHQGFAIMAWVVLLAVFPLTHKGNDPWTVGVVAAQTEIVQGTTPPHESFPLVGTPGSNEQLEELLREKTWLMPLEQKIDSKIRATTRRLKRSVADAPSGETPPFTDFSNDLVKINERGEVQVYVILTNFTEDGVAQLETLGLRVELTLPEHRLIQGWARYDAIERIAALDKVEKITLPDYARHNSGAVNSQGDAVLRADLARSTFGVSGSGVKVCVISDGVDHLVTSMASGDLPGSPPVQVLNNPGGDEGTAMLEIIHDLAPESPLAFYGVRSSAEFLQALDAFAVAGCRVIVDDIGFPGQPKFEDGMVAQRVRQLMTGGIVYVTAAGNNAQNHYIANYRRLPGGNFPTTSYPAVHSFSAGDDIGDTFVIPPNGTVTVILQWSNGFGASADDFDLFLFRSDNGSILPCASGPGGLCVSIVKQNGQSDPIEGLSYTNTTGSPITAFIAIAEFHLVSSPSSIKLNYFVSSKNFNLIHQYIVSEDSVFGHAAVNGVLSVAAVNAATPTLIEPFSSRGPATILFPTPETRNLPNISAVDGVQTRTGQLGFFGNPFFGTSAAAPHVAAIAALLWQLNPAFTSNQVVQILTESAVDLGVPGYDTVFGFGRVDAFQALSASASFAASAFVTRLYQQVLNRAPEPGGVAGWVQQIEQFDSVVPTVLAFFHSTEFLNRNTSNSQFLNILYLTFLSRPPDSTGFNAFLAALQLGQFTRDNLLDIFMDSGEFTALASFLPSLNPLSDFVTTLYVRILGRGPDQPGLQSFVAQLQQTRTVLPTVQFFLNSPEFLARNTSNTEFVTLLYRVFLGRVPDPVGRTTWVNALNQGTTTRNQLVLLFAASPEFQAIQHQLFP